MQSNKSNRPVSYTPTLDGRKWITTTTSKGDNGGIHKQEEFKKAVTTLLHCAHNLPNSRLFHLCFTGGMLKHYKLVIKRLCRALKEKNVVTEYKAGIEYSKSKGKHVHLFIILSGQYQKTERFITAADESENISNNHDSTLLKVIKRTRAESAILDYKVILPKKPNIDPLDEISENRIAFLQINETNQEFFDNAIDWLSYAYKLRSKLLGQQCYLSSKPNK